MDKKFEELEIRDDFMFGVIMRNPKYCKPGDEKVLDFIDGKEPADDYTRDLAEAAFYFTQLLALDIDEC